MTISIRAFGVVKEIFGAISVNVDLPENATAKILKGHLQEIYPALSKLTSFALAVNSEYANDETVISSKDEVAIIPPVSGG